MESMKVLADTSMKISEAKGVIFKLQETETEYLVEREEKAMTRINKLFSDSKDLLDKTKNNHEEIRKYAATVSEFHEFLNKTFDTFQSLLSNFNERNDLWERNIRKKEEEMASMKEEIKAEQKLIEIDKKDIEEKRKSIKQAQEQIESRQTTLLQSYNSEKELWNKIISKKS